MILPIYTYGQPVLRKVCRDIDPGRPGLKELVANMFETMDKASGVGLAGPQVGLDERVVVIDLDVISDEYPEFKGYRKAFFNAHVLETDGELVTMDEGCLSLPGISEPVERHDRVHVTYLDEDMQPHDEWVEGFLARVMQHEFDHLEGNLFIDHLSAFRRKMNNRALNKMLKGKARSSYKMKQIGR